VAILVDEYDSPLLKTVHNSPLAREMRDIIQQFFTVIKSLDQYIQFVFITGVSSFAKAGLFSGINNLRIITLQDQYAALCGYTDTEVDYYLREYIQAWSDEHQLSYQELRQKIKQWYNGYHFGENALSVYNPFSVMNALESKKFKNFWFQSGTPRFLIEILKENKHSFDPEKFTATEYSLGIFDIEHIPLATLMFQTGYLTIKRYDPELDLFYLDYPNDEVRISFQKYLLEIFTTIPSSDADRASKELKLALFEENIDECIKLLHYFFAHVPYQLYSKEEKYYHSLLMMICIAAGIKAQSEYSTNVGRIDLIIQFPLHMYVIEIKFNNSAEQALTQIEERRYYERFIKEGKKIILLGLNFKKGPKKFDIEYAVKIINI
jgi:hypothetical protein